jgi:hypothetical protein
MDRFTRLVVLGSLLAALALEVVLVARGFPGVRTASLAAFLAALALSLAWPRLGAALVLVFTYIAPAVISIFVGSRDSGYQVVWLAALAGPVMATAGWRAWRFPRAWRWPLVLWMLSIALTWPIVVLRECNFDPHLLTVVHLANSGIGIPPPIETVAITRAALTLGLPLLWFEWLFGVFGGAAGTGRAGTKAGPYEPGVGGQGAGTAGRNYTGFLLCVIAPLAVSWLLCDAAGLYQAFVDMDFLNGGLFGYMGRASGTMLDANPFGVITAMWGAAIFAAGVGSRRWLRMAGGLAGLLLAWIGVWASGSRTAIGTAAVAVVFIAWAAFQTIRSGRTRTWLLGGLVASGVIVLALVAWAPTTDVSGFTRLRNTLPGASLSSVKQFATEMWNRNHYGEASTAMIREFPLVGVGLGSFATLVVDYGKPFNNDTWLTPDNAQNWYRHQIAQMGVIGSVGWIIWIAMLGAYFWRASRRAFEATVILGVLVGVALVSLVGMPTANAAAALTVMVFLFWYVALAGEAPDGTLPAGEEGSRLQASGYSLRPAVHGPGWKPWVAMWAIVGIFVAGTAYVGATKLRPPDRALQFDWEYVSGFYPLEHPPTGAPFRWTSQRAVDVFPIKGRYLKLTFRIHHPEASQNPVEAKAWTRDRAIADVTLRDSSPVTEYVLAPEGQKRMMIGTWVSRTWRPSDRGSKDTRELGLQIDDWTFVDKPPAGATVVE